MKTKLYRKWLEVAADHALNKTWRKKLVELVCLGKWVSELEMHAVHKCGLALQYWHADTCGMATVFRKQYAKFSRRYYDADNVLKRIIETGHED